MNPDSASRCRRCARPQDRCLCALIPLLASATRVLVIQHPSERRHALNTARFLVEGLVNAELLITEQLAGDDRWNTVLLDPDWRTELLFPGPGAEVIGCGGADNRPRRLILLDGTWRKARKLLHLNPVLSGLPRVTLPAGQTSRYRLRKAPGPEALSTIEAAVCALQLIEPETDFHPLLIPFEALIAAQIGAMGVETFKSNYPVSC